MSNLESVLFTSVKPLVANGFFAPPFWDDVLQYNFIDVALLANTNCAITVYQSPDRQNITSTAVYTTTANHPFTIAIPLYVRYVQLRVDNTQATTQTIFSLQTIYKQSSTIGNTTANDVNIHDSSGNTINSDGAGSLNTNLNAINANFIDAINGNGLRVVVENTTPISVSESTLDGCISSGVLKTALFTSSGIALTTTYNSTYGNYSIDTNNKVIENCVSGNQLQVVEATLDGAISGNQMQCNITNNSLIVSEQTLDGCITSNQVAVNVANTTPINVSNLIPAGQTYQRIVVASGSNLSGSVSGAHTLLKVIISSDDNGGAASYLKLYDSAAPVLGTDTPITVITLGNYNFGESVGMQFANGIGYGISGDIADNSTSGANSNLSITLIYI